MVVSLIVLAVVILVARYKIGVIVGIVGIIGFRGFVAGTLYGYWPGLIVAGICWLIVWLAIRSIPARHYNEYYKD